MGIRFGRLEMVDISNSSRNNRIYNNRIHFKFIRNDYTALENVMKFNSEEEERKYLERLHNYTKFKLVEMLIDKYKDKKIQNLNVMEELAESVLEVLDDVGNNYVE